MMYHSSSDDMILTHKPFQTNQPTLKWGFQDECQCEAGHISPPVMLTWTNKLFQKPEHARTEWT